MEERQINRTKIRCIRRPPLWEHRVSKLQKCVLMFTTNSGFLTSFDNFSGNFRIVFVHIKLYISNQDAYKVGSGSHMAWNVHFFERIMGHWVFQNSTNCNRHNNVANFFFQTYLIQIINIASKLLTQTIANTTTIEDIIKATTIKIPNLGFFHNIQARIGVNRKKFMSQATYHD